MADRDIEQAADAVDGPALVYVCDNAQTDPAFVRVDTADEQTFQWMDARSLSLLDVLLTEAQRRLHVWREDQFK